MNKVLIWLSFLCAAEIVSAQDFVFPAANDYPEIRQFAAKTGDFVPAGWTLVTSAFGDLNQDKELDCVLVVKANDRKFLNKGAGFGGELDANPRILIVLFKNANGYRLAIQNNSIIKIPESPAMVEPFEAVEIKNGVLRLDFELFFSMGSWSAAKAFYKFRYQNGEFVLIGADKSDFQRNSGEYEDRSYNFLTNKLIVTTGNHSEDKPRKVRRRSFKLKRLKTLNTFVEPFSWEIEKDYLL